MAKQVKIYCGLCNRELGVCDKKERPLCAWCPICKEENGGDTDKIVNKIVTKKLEEEYGRRK